jgi:hypothetical protein
MLSGDRLTSYMVLATPPQNKQAALQLYVWNAALSGALFGPLQAVEIAIRTIHREMASVYNLRSARDRVVLKRSFSPVMIPNWEERIIVPDLASPVAQVR